MSHVVVVVDKSEKCEAMISSGGDNE